LLPWFYQLKINQLLDEEKYDEGSKLLDEMIIFVWRRPGDLFAPDTHFRSSKKD
jgi:hypothetical protein